LLNMGNVELKIIGCSCGLGVRCKVCRKKEKKKKKIESIKDNVIF